MVALLWTMAGLQPATGGAESVASLACLSARLVAQNELNLREAWLRTELFQQRLALTVGRLDLTNYFDQNAFANDETKMGGETAAVPSFTTLDANRDGSVSKEEAASSSTVLSQWDSLDADQDGSLSSTEFANVTGSSTMDETTAPTTDDSSNSSARANLVDSRSCVWSLAVSLWWSHALAAGTRARGCSSTCGQISFRARSSSRSTIARPDPAR